jgi:hypothetical protein
MVAVFISKNSVKWAMTLNNIIGGEEKFCNRKKVRQVELKKSNFSRESFKE